MLFILGIFQFIVPTLLFLGKLVHRELKNSPVVYNEPEIKRGCSEFPIVFPNYAILPDTENEHMNYPIEWHDVEKKFDKNDINFNSKFYFKDFEPE